MGDVKPNLTFHRLIGLIATMPRLADPEVFLDLPTAPGTDALRAGLMAMKCIPINLPLNAAERHAAVKRAAHSDKSFLLIDVSNREPGSTDSLAAVCRDLPVALRSRTLLTRLGGGHVSSDDRSWAKQLGFVDFIAEINVGDVEGDLRVVIDAAARLLGLEPLSLAELARYVGATAASAKASALHLPRAVIRAHTGLSAEKLAEVLRDGLAIQDRSYHFKKYPACFVASEAVMWMSSKLRLESAQAMAVGQALGALGLLYHVEQKHVFADEQWFFRLSVARSANKMGFTEVVKVLRERLNVADRTYLAATYPNCWVGSQAVDAIITHQPMQRHEAHRILHRLMSFGLFRHVLDEQPFVDGNFFYRFT